METRIKRTTLATAVMLLSIPWLTGNAQDTYRSATTHVTINGTSTLHDWNMGSSSGQTTASFTIEGNQVKKINTLTFTVAAESLKSDKSALDKNAYKALDTDKHKNITFTMTSGTVTATGSNAFQVKATGRLTIAGATRQTTIAATGQFNPSDKSVTFNGSTTFKMTVYDVKPPTVMMGTIKTGDEIIVSYNGKLTAQ